MKSRFPHTAVIGALSLLTLSLPALGQSICFASNPLDAMTVTSPFGQRFHPVRKVWTCHCGVDLRARTPLPMKAVDSGIIRMARTIHGGGNTIEIMLDKGVVVQYMHASMLIRQMGDRVAAGELVGKTGNTGEWTTGPHLHFVAKVNGSQPVDPTQFFCGGVPSEPGAALPPAPPPDTPPGQPPASPPAPDPNAPVNVGGGVTGINVPPVQGFPSLDDISLRELMYSETHKRFMNPQWLLELENPGAVAREDPKATLDPNAAVTAPRIHLLRELNQMQSLRNLMASAHYDNRESIEARLAALLSIDAKNYADKIQAMARHSSGISR